MLALNTWANGLEEKHQSLIRDWSLSSKKALFQMLTISAPLNTRQEKLLDRIALTFFKTIQPSSDWYEFIGEKQPIQSALNEKQRLLEIERSTIKNALLTKNREVEEPLSEDEVDHLLCQYFEVRQLIEKWSSCSLSELYEIGKNGLSSDGINTKESLALCCLVMKKKFSISPYYTQIIAVLAALSKNAGIRGRLSQVKTGEGKTLIITLLAFVLVMQKKGVDIISSSQYLAIRDQKKYADFFKEFGISTAHICEDSKEKVNFDAHILYGMATDFEFPLMREKVQNEELFVCKKRERSFDCVIVDEVDNLLIDTALNSARISYPSLRTSSREIYPLIYSHVKAHGVTGLQDLQEIIKTKHLEISDKELYGLMNAAETALNQREEVDYVVHSNDSHPYGKKLSVKIIDHENTGQVQEGMRWSHGIHEFLEVKHGIELDKETMTPISLSHVIFYDRYEKIFGFSGTLGSSFERDHIKEIYQIDTFDLPSYRPSSRVDLPITNFVSIEKMRKGLIQKTQSLQGQRRPVLILCQSIKKTGELGALFQRHQISHQLYNEMQEEDAETIILNAGNPGMITVSTNNAGRGTDIALTEESLHNGGLHVIFTYYSTSKRVEDQGIGRAGRQGQIGSSEIFVVTDKTTERLSANRLRDEAQRSSILTKRATFEREIHCYVDQFWDFIGAWKKQIKNGNYIEDAIAHLTPKHKELAIEAILGHKKNMGSFDFIIEELLSKIEGEIFQRWSETFFEPSERLMFEAQSSAGTNREFKKSLDLLFKESQKSWMPFIKEDGSGCALWINMKTSHNL